MIVGRTLNRSTKSEGRILVDVIVESKSQIQTSKTETVQGISKHVTEVSRSLVALITIWISARTNAS